MDYSRELAFAKQLAYQAGAIIKANFTTIMKAEQKSDGSPVTDADLAINQIVIDAIMRSYPDHDIMGEEQSRNTGEKEYVWICDPLDGTMPFSHGVPTSMFSLALCERSGEPLVAVCYDPYMDRLFTAVLGEGAQLNGTPIHPTYRPIKLKEHINLLPSLSSLTRPGVLLDQAKRDKWSPFGIGSFVYSCCVVASGAVKAAILSGVNPWDRAAAKLIVTEAGLLFMDEHGADVPVMYRPRAIIICHKQDREYFVKFMEPAL